MDYKRKITEFLLEVGENLYKAWVNGFYPFFILLLFTTTLYGQSSERTQKQAKVIEHRAQSQQQYNPNPNRNPNRTPQRLRRVYRPYYYNPNIYGYNPYWNPNRSWDNRRYIVTTDTNLIKSQPKPLRFSFGVLSEVTTQTPTLSPYMILGGKSFLILQYHLSTPTPYTYYPNIYQWEVDEWEDTFMGSASDRREFVIGFGKTIKRFSPFIGIGFSNERSWDCYEDETFTLSPQRLGGIYMINEDTYRSVSMKVGTLYHWDSFEVLSQLHLGKELRFGIGIGIKL